MGDAGKLAEKSPGPGEPGGTMADIYELQAAHKQRPGDELATKDRPSGDEEA